MRIKNSKIITMKKYLLFLLLFFISLGFSGYLIFTKTANSVSATCVPSCSDYTGTCGGTTYSDWWECNNGNMCCHGSGCPSWVCEGELEPLCPAAPSNCTYLGMTDVTYNEGNNECSGKCHYSCTSGDHDRYVTKDKTVDLTPPHCCVSCSTSCTVTSWGPCSAACDGGTQTSNCGTTQDCNTQMCPPDITDFYIAKSLYSMDKNNTYTMNQTTHIPFYIVLAAQMHIYKLPIKWQVLTLHNGSCTASCTYTDNQGNLLSDVDCQWHDLGNVGAQGIQQVQPQTHGIVTYTLNCNNAGGSDTKTFQLGVKLFSWREVLRGIYDSASQFTAYTHFGFASVLDAIKAKLSLGQ